MNIVVTGGAGFIGSNLCSSLLSSGHKVTAVDCLITGRLENLDACFKNRNFTFIESRTEEMPDLEAEALFHLASPASPVGYGRYPLETLSANAQGTWRVLDVCHRSGASFLLASTSEVYGDPLEHPQRETYFGNVDPVGPRACYDEGKRFAEALTFSYGEQFQVNARIVRIFNCYGPGNALDDGRMVPTFVRQALTGEPMTIYGNGTQTRSLCFVEDLVRGLERAMFTHGTAGRIYNLGNPEEHSVEDFARVIRDLSGSNSELVHEEARPAEIARRKPDISRARSELCWCPQTSLSSGISATIAWARTQL